MSSHAIRIFGAVPIAVALGFSAAAGADEGQLKLKDGPGRAKVMANCVMCHSVDYVLMNSPFLKKAGWQATVTKMVKVMGAPINPDDVPPIVDYLTKYYGVE